MDLVSMRGAKVEHSGGHVGLLQQSRGVKDTFAARRIILRCALGACDAAGLMQENFEPQITHPAWGCGSSSLLRADRRGTPYTACPAASIRRTSSACSMARSRPALLPSNK